MPTLTLHYLHMHVCVSLSLSIYIYIYIYIIVIIAGKLHIFQAHTIGCDAVSWCPVTPAGSLLQPQQGNGGTSDILSCLLEIETHPRPSELFAELSYPRPSELFYYSELFARDRDSEIFMTVPRRGIRNRLKRGI